jgi:hypothetical protein
MSPNRLVTILTPLVFAPLAGALTAWVAQNAPGLPALDSAQVTALFIAGATIAFGKAALWLGAEPDPVDDIAMAEKPTGVASLEPGGEFDPALPFEFQAHSEPNGEPLALPMG